MTDLKNPEPREIQAALEILTRYAVTAPAVPVDKIAKQEGARIQYGPLDKDLSGMFFVKDGVAVIGVNSLHHPNRQRFTIGHELGHMALHRELIGSGVHVDKELAILYRDVTAATGTNKIEIEANNFAAYLLVPDFLLDEVIGDNFALAANEQEIETLAKKFKVSLLTMQLRLRRWIKQKAPRG